MIPTLLLCTSPYHRHNYLVAYFISTVSWTFSTFPALPPLSFTPFLAANFPWVVCPNSPELARISLACSLVSVPRSVFAGLRIQSNFNVAHFCQTLVSNLQSLAHSATRKERLSHIVILSLVIHFPGKDLGSRVWGFEHAALPALSSHDGQNAISSFRGFPRGSLASNKIFREEPRRLKDSLEQKFRFVGKKGANLGCPSFSPPLP